MEKMLRIAPLTTPLWAAAILLACSPAQVVTDDGCIVDDDCSGSEICVEGSCYGPGAVPCDNDDICVPLGQSCLNGYCSPLDLGDAGYPDVTEPDAAEPDAAGIGTGDGIISIESEQPIDFGSPIFGVAIDRVLTIRNVGTSGLRVIGVDLSQATSAEFVLDPSGAGASALLAPQEALDVLISYTLTDGEADIGEIEVMSDAVGCAQFCSNPHLVRVPLYSEFKGARNLAVTPESHDFGFQEAASSSLYAPFAVSNDGTLTKVLTVSAVRLEGADASHFELMADPTPYYLAPVAEQVARVRYVPQNTAFHSAELVVEANSDDPQRQVVRVTLSGRSLPSAAIAVPPNLDFGEVEVGTHRDLDTSIENIGGMAATVLSPAAFQTGSEGYALLGPILPLTLPPAQPQSFSLRFEPSGPGQFTDVLMLDHDADGSPLAITLTGRGVLPPQGYSNVRVEQSFSRAFSETLACGFRVNFQNVDLRVGVGPYVCDKNAGGCDADVCNCSLGSYGSAVWSCNNCSGQTASSESVSNFGSGSDGSFEVRAFYFDNCAAGYFDQSAAVLQGVCAIAGLREACYPYSVFPVLYPDEVHISETQCLHYVPWLAGRCQATAPTEVRTTVYLSDGTGPDQTRIFCTQLMSVGQEEEVARLERSAGLFSLTGAIGNSWEIDASDPCGH